MQLIGQAIRHEMFGKGVVTGLNENVLTICFSEGEKKFIYPDAFEQYLTLKNSEMQDEMEQELKERETAEEKRLQAIREKQERKHRLYEMKVCRCAQAVFDVKPEKKKRLFSEWTISAGCYLSGYSKGEPRVPDRLKPYSLCLMTERPENGSEEQRQIIGAFMVPEEFDGTDCQDGIIAAHPQFRLQLQQPVCFWPYVTQEKEKMRWGKTVFKYASNVTMEKILFDFRALLQDTEQTEDAEQLYQYFCKLNHLSVRPMMQETDAI